MEALGLCRGRVKITVELVVDELGFTCQRA